MVHFKHVPYNENSSPMRMGLRRSIGISGYLHIMESLEKWDEPEDMFEHLNHVHFGTSNK